MLSSREIRRKFLDFFASKNHVEVPSSSLIPAADDPTVLFTTAGMQQFVPYLMGQTHPQGKRLCSVQKCVRTVDIDEVGDNRHLTFFEMLGNWSLGDYFKPEAIEWSYEFLTKHLGIPHDKLWVTVFAGDADVPLDEESIKFWEARGISSERIVPIGPKPGGKKGRGDNFWGPAGKTGPCGPCTEMYVDVLDTPLEPGDNPLTNEERFLEVWNDVFMEYFQDEHGKLTKLKQRNVDTGMGLERMTMVLNRKQTVFETDIFDALFAAIEELSGQKYPPYAGDLSPQNPVTRAMRVIADHVRSAAHMLADGGVPSNEGRGYVLRRLIRRAVRFGRTLGIEKPFLVPVLAPYLQEFMEFYPELAQRREVIENALQNEEERFLETLGKGEAMLAELLQGKKELSGATAFKMYDTYGFPLELIREIAQERGVDVDEVGFQAEMKAQKERSRAARGSFFERGAKDRAGFEGLPSTEFVGYDSTETEANLLALEYAAKGTEGSHLMVEVVLDRTPFYAESGGQIGDTGILQGANGMIKVLDTKRLPGGIFVHRGEIVQGEFSVGDKVIAKVDDKRRAQIRRHHSLTHLLHAALKKVLGSHASQQGSLVAPDFARFDFTHPKAVTPEELRQIEMLLATWVQAAFPVEVKPMELEAAKKAGAEALFSEKYDREVRTIRMGEVSFELCGGTHVQNTAEIGAIKIRSEGSVASGIRRIEIVCAAAAQQLLWGQSDGVQQIAMKLKVPTDQILSRIEAVFAEKKLLEEQLQQSAKALVRFEALELADLIHEASGHKFICEPIPTGDLKKLGLIAKELVSTGIDLAALFTRDGGVVIASKGQIAAKEVLQQVAAFAGGSGGGGAEFAQGAKINLEEFRGIKEIVEKIVNSLK